MTVWQPDSMRVIKKLSGFSSSTDSDVSIPEYLLRQLKISSRPDCLVTLNAICGVSAKYTLAQVNDRANLIANHLLECGIKSGDVLAVCLSRSLDLIATLIACLKLSVCYMPIETKYPLAFRQELLRIANVKYLVTESSEDIDVKIIHLADISGNNISEPYTSYPLSDYDAIVFYSSGTTGRPKGVRHTQRQMMNRLQWMWRIVPFQERDILGIRCSISVMPSIWELLGGILSDVSTVIFHDEILKNVGSIFHAIKSYKITFMSIATPLLRVLIAQDHISEDLRVVITGGELITLNNVDQFNNIFPNALLIDDYGTTETNTALYRVFYPHVKYSNLPGFAPIDNVSAYVIPDEESSSNLLFISGDALSKGYTNDELTAQRFITLPEGVRCYNTLDAVDISEDNHLVLLGRSDNLVKINGYSIELSALELRIQEVIPQIDEVLLTFYSNSGGDNILCAFVVLSRDFHSEIQLRSHFQENFPEHMIPSNFKYVVELPRTANGKLDRSTAWKMIQDERRHFVFESGIALKSNITNIIADLLSCSSDQIDQSTSFSDLGLTSVLMMQLSLRVSSAVGKNIAVSVFYDYYTIDLLADFLEDNTTENKINYPKASYSSEIGEVVIIGFSGRFGAAKDVSEISNVLLSNQALPTNAFSRPHWSDQNRSNYYGLPDISLFDHEFFNIKRCDAIFMDPQLRFLLEEVYHVIEASGVSAKTLSGERVGVFVGAQPGDYGQLLNQEEMPGSAVLVNDFSFLASQISYHFNFKGPSLVFDTACSSSLVALHAAVKAIKTGEVSSAIVAGVSIKSMESFVNNTRKLTVLSKKGRCSPFSYDADGFNIGEGVGCIFLCSENMAVNKNHTIYGVIKNIEIAQEGRTNGFAAPSGIEQAELISRCYRNANLNPEDLCYYEAHGTGTEIGDPIEFSAAAEAIKQFTGKTQYCPIGSVKANIGHATAAAGMASIIKVLGCFQAGMYPPLVHFQQINPLIRTDDSAFYIPTASIPIARENAQLVGISSFGMGGMIAHLALGYHPEQKEKNCEVEYLPYLITAKTKSSLMARVKSWVKFLSQSLVDSDLNICNLSYTSLCGLHWHDYRVGVVASSAGELLEKLKKIEDSDVAVCQQPKFYDHFEDCDSECLNNSRQLMVYLGEIIKYPYRDCKQLYNGLNVKKISIPAYEFEAKSLWYDSKKTTIDLEKSENNSHSIEARLLELIAETFELEKVSCGDTLESIGYDSVNMLLLQQSIERQFGEKLPLEVFKSTTKIDDLLLKIQSNSITSEEESLLISGVNELNEEELMNLFNDLVKEKEV